MQGQKPAQLSDTLSCGIGFSNCVKGKKDFTFPPQPFFSYFPRPFLFAKSLFLSSFSPPPPLAPTPLFSLIMFLPEKLSRKFFKPKLSFPRAFLSFFLPFPFSRGDDGEEGKGRRRRIDPFDKQAYCLRTPPTFSGRPPPSSKKVGEAPPNLQKEPENINFFSPAVVFSLRVPPPSPPRQEERASSKLSFFYSLFCGIIKVAPTPKPPRGRGRGAGLPPGKKCTKHLYTRCDTTKMSTFPKYKLSLGIFADP